MRASEQALMDLQNAIATAGESYRANLQKVTNLVNEITTGAIKGNVAEQFKALFESKKEQFESIQTTFDNTEKHIESEKSGFVNLVDDVNNAMR